MVIFPLAPDQTIAQMWSNGARGGKCGPTDISRTSTLSSVSAILSAILPSSVTMADDSGKMTVWAMGKKDAGVLMGKKREILRDVSRFYQVKTELCRHLQWV